MDGGFASGSATGVINGGSATGVINGGSATRYRSWTLGFKGPCASHYTMAEPVFSLIRQSFFKLERSPVHLLNYWPTPK